MNHTLEELAELLLLIHESYFDNTACCDCLVNMIAFISDLRLFGNIITITDIERVRTVLISTYLPCINDCFPALFNYDMFYEFLKAVAKLVFGSSSTSMQRLLTYHIIPLCKRGLPISLNQASKYLSDIRLTECVVYDNFFKCLFLELCLHNRLVIANFLLAYLFYFILLIIGHMQMLQYSTAMVKTCIGGCWCGIC